MPNLTTSQCKKILQLPDDFDMKLLKKQYHLLSKKYHPDKPLEKPQEEIDKIKEQFYVIKEAYEILLNLQNNPNSNIKVSNEINNKHSSKINHDYLYKKGMKYYKEGDINNALECFNKAYQIDNENTNYERAIIKCLMQKERRLLEAKERCVELTKKESFNAENFYLLGKIYKKAGFYDAAKDIFKKSLSLGFNKNLIEKELSLENSEDKKPLFKKIFPFISWCYGYNINSLCK